MAERDGIVYLRTTRAATPVIYGAEDDFPVGGSRVLRSSDDDEVTIAAAGITLHEALAAADALADEGIHLVLVAADDDLARRVLTARLLGDDAVEAMGWPTEDADAAVGSGTIDDAEWMAQVVAVRDGLWATRDLRGDPEGLLAALGSPRLAAATGLLLGAAARQTPAVPDGPGAAAAALLVRDQAWEAPDWWQAAQPPVDQLHERALASLRLTPLGALGVRTEDGTGALLACDLVAAAAGLLSGGGTPEAAVELPSPG
jgi:hypothetical protein